MLNDIAGSSNGRTADSESVNLGSNPGPAAYAKPLAFLGERLSIILLVWIRTGKGSGKRKFSCGGGTGTARCQKILRIQNFV